MSDKDLIQEAIDYARRYWQHGSETRTQYVLKVLADALEARQVDEAAVEKIAQVIYEHSEVTEDGMRCQCGYPSEGDLALHQARAVVEFLGERHEPDSGKCGGCRDLGPHRNVPGCDYYEPEPDARHTSENLVYEPRQDAALPWSGVKITPSENDVRERIAGEIEADLEDGSSCIQHVYFAEGMRHAAEIARSGR